MALLHEGYAKKWHYDETGSHNAETTSRNGETTSHNDKTTSHNGETTSHNDKTTPRNGETTSHNSKTTPRNGETTPRNGETTSHNDKTTSHNDESTSHNDKTTSHNDETTSHNGETTSCNNVWPHKKVMAFHTRGNFRFVQPTFSLILDSPTGRVFRPTVELTTFLPPYSINLNPSCSRLKMKGAKKLNLMTALSCFQWTAERILVKTHFWLMPMGCG